MANYIIKPAPYAFTCPLYGITVKVGENCVEENGMLFCIKTLEDKPLSPIKRSIYLGKNRNSFKPGTASYDNLKMRTELEVIAENPDGAAAKKIISKYQRILAARRESRLSKEN